MWTLYLWVITVFGVKLRTYSFYCLFYMCLFILWYIFNELHIQAYHYKVYLSKCQTCATVVIVVDYANKANRLGDSLKRGLSNLFLSTYMLLLIVVLYETSRRNTMTKPKRPIDIDGNIKIVLLWYYFLRYPNCWQSGKWVYNLKRTLTIGIIRL